MADGSVPSERIGFMIKRLKSSLVWQFSGGFVIGAIGLLVLQPADATRAMVHHIVPTHEVR